MKRYYNNPQYDAAFDRWLSTVSRLMIKYGPRVLLKQKCEKTLGLKKGEVIVHSSADSAVRERRFSGYRKRLKESFSSKDKKR